MTVLPVIARELRAEARHAFTYWLRVLGAGALMLVVLFSHEDFKVVSSRGLHLFGVLHGTLFGLIWIFVPLLTADCISREKRQGTLGLLFLTPLKPSDIVIAKSLAHGLRSLALCLAVVPVLTIPFLMGGVSWTDVLFSMLVLGSAFCWALAAGLLASAWNRRWVRALALAAVLAGLFFILFAYLNGYLFRMLFPMLPGYMLYKSFWHVASDGASFAFMGPSLLRFPFFAPIQPLKLAADAFAMFLASALFLLYSLLFCAAKIRRTWREEPPSALQVWLRDVFCQPMFLVPLYRRLMRRKVEKNPIGWLQQRTWSGRVVTWIWFGILVSFYSFMLTDPRFYGVGFISLQHLLAFGLLISMAATAAGSFQRERETGMLELLLVSPIKTGQVLGGRLRGIWGQFLLVLVLWLWVWIYFTKAFGWKIWQRTDEPIAVGFFVCSFLTVPVIGLYCSLRCRHYMSSLISTLVFGLFVPMYLGGVLERFQNSGANGRVLNWLGGFLYAFFGSLRITFWASAAQIVIATWVTISLYGNLARRKFAALERRE